jgi:uncharacterized membrane protein
MSNENLRSAARLAQIPIHPMFVSFPIVCFVGALLTDLTYWRTAEMMWADFSVWLITVGLIMGFLTAIAGLVDFLFSRAIRAQRLAWVHMLGNLFVMLLSLFNVLVHGRDGWTSVVPTGLILSAAVVFVLLIPSCSRASTKTDSRRSPPASRRESRPSGDRVPAADTPTSRNWFKACAMASG